MSRSTRIMRTRLLRGLGLLTVVALAGVATHGLWLSWIGRWLAMPGTMEMQRADAIVVHGGNPARREYGAELYHRGLAPEMWLTGYASTQRHIVGVVVEKLGVPSDRLHYLVTTSTWSDGQQIAQAIRARKLHSVLVVTDWWHSRRALCATEQQLDGYDVSIAFEPAPAPAGPENWWRDDATRKDILSELIKLAYYAVRYGMTPWGC